MNFLRFNRSDAWYSLLLVGIAAALASFVAAILAIRVLYPGDLGGDWQSWWAMLPPDDKPLPLFAGMASAVLGPAFWWWIIIKPGRLSVRRGILVGALVGIVAHPIVWYAAFVSAYFTGQQTVIRFQVTNPLEDLVTAMFLAAFSVIIVGWLTALIGGAFGGVIALLQSVSGCRGRWQAALSSSFHP